MLTNGLGVWESDGVKVNSTSGKLAILTENQAFAGCKLCNRTGSNDDEKAMRCFACPIGKWVLAWSEGKDTPDDPDEV